jgi:alpha,alpha-trehalase
MPWCTDAPTRWAGTSIAVPLAAGAAPPAMIRRLTSIKRPRADAFTLHGPGWPGDRPGGDLDDAPARPRAPVRAHGGDAMPALTIPVRDIDAVVFDLDGVVTRTARLHAAAWKQMFDDFFAVHHPDQPPFDLHGEYRSRVDGKPRHDGVRSVLRARGIALPEGSADDPPGTATVRGLARRKNALYLSRLASDGAEVFESTLGLLRALRAAGIRTAVVSASRNAAAVLDAAGVSDLFDVRVDGLDAEREGLCGKPAPDTFLAALRRLGVRPPRAVLVEDAQSGVQAGRAGGFRLVIGVDRADQAEALRAHGADVVVRDLAEVALATDGPPAAGPRSGDQEGRR